MADSTLTGVGATLSEEPAIRRRRALSPIWAVPIVAALAAAWLGYTAWAEKGPEISITFNTAAGIEPGKTRVKYHDIELGIVDHVDPSRDLQHVVVKASMNKMAAEHLRTGTSFWVVRPRLSFSGLSGLETLVSGAYIEMDPGDGQKATSFTGLEEPPVIRSDVPGREFELTTTKLGGLAAGSPINFRGIKVGEVMSYNFAGDSGAITVRIFIQSPFDDLVRDETRFWNASGVSLSAGASGLKVEVESFQALLAGGIAFDTAEDARASAPSKEGTTFTLFEDREEARDASYTRAKRAIVDFGGSVRGLTVGAPVEFRGIRVGKVTDFHLEFNPTTQEFRIPVGLVAELGRMRIVGGDPEGRYGSGALLPELVKKGLRAQLRSGSLITGQLVVALDFFPDAPPAEIQMVDGVPKLPTVPNDLENITRSLTDTLDRIAALPLDQVVQDIRKLLASVLSLTDSPDVKETAKLVNAMITQADRLLRDANGQVVPLATGLRKTSDAAEAALKQLDTTLAGFGSGYGRDSKVRSDLSELLRQLQETARSVRVLATYLEQHPEALVRGKGGSQ